jgi:hypothetical protein
MTWKSTSDKSSKEIAMSEPTAFEPSYPIFTPAVPWLSSEPFASHMPIEAYMIQCPICGFDYNHHAGHIDIDGQDAYKAWAGRGDVCGLLFDGECGHRWSLRFGFHKGQMYVSWKDEGIVPDFGEGAVSLEEQEGGLE